jgi:UDP-glucose 4-epimerase
LLREAGRDVTGLDIAPSLHTDVVGSVADRPLIDHIFAERPFEGVIHSGALHKLDIARHSRQDFNDTNVTGILNLLEAAVRHGTSRVIFTWTTSLMITQAIRDETSEAAVLLDETSGPLGPRNIYGATKGAAEELCRLVHTDSDIPIIILRTARFFPEGDDTHRTLSGESMKANEFLHRRLTVEDCALAHVAALDKAHQLGFGLYTVSAPQAFEPDDCAVLKAKASHVIARHFPEAAAIYARRGWSLPSSIGRVYDASLIERDLGFRRKAEFAAVLASLHDGDRLPFAHDPFCVSPKEARATRRCVQED